VAHTKLSHPGSGPGAPHLQTKDRLSDRGNGQYGQHDRGLRLQYSHRDLHRPRGQAGLASLFGLEDVPALH
jgi:hypothetical protein